MDTIVAAMVYHILWTRNNAYWNHKICNINSLVHIIQKQNIDRCYSVLPRKVSCKDKEWLRSLAM